MPTAAPLDFLPPRLDGRVLALSRRMLPWYLRRQCAITSLEVQNLERLVAAMDRFQAGESRLLLAFRHPSVDDPACLAHLIWRDLAREGRRLGRQWRPRPHFQFLYDRGIPLWAGPRIGWLLQRLGGCSIQRGKLDTAALRTARQLLLDGPYPLAVAPEGATNGHNERLSALEPGAAQLAFWTADDLAKAQRPEAMTVLPIGVQYRFSGNAWPAIEALLCQLERQSGLATQPAASPDPEALYPRLFALAERMLTLMETFYRDSYHRDLPAASATTTTTTTAAAAAAPAAAGAAAAGAAAAATPAATAKPAVAQTANLALAERLGRLLETALAEVELSLAIEPRGDLASRCRRLEQAAWDRLYLAAPPTPLERGLADRLAEETAQRLWHMRLVESFVAVSGDYVKERPSQERFADTLLLLWDTQARILGRDPGTRPRLGPRTALISLGEAIAFTPLLEDYHRDRRRAVARLTADLQRQLEALIVPSGLAA
jgi:hypothetical protein